MAENNHIPAPHQVSIEVGGRTLILETGKIAKQANGAVTARYGDTVVLVTACMDPRPVTGIFCPSPWTIAKTPIPPERFPEDFSSAKGVPRRGKFWFRA